MKYHIVVFVVVLLSLLIVGAREKREELAPAEPAPAEVLSKPGEGKAESREELIEKREYKEEMKERAKNEGNL